jgi:bifunctional UDP-N-acetylglucosamine pyrophosphorylase/glucosamine-1-phosphate N-acetyltransferase
MDTVQVIILAAGKGKRMESDLPKALTPLAQKPFLGHILEKIQTLGLSKQPVIVVGHKHEDVRSFAGDAYGYAHQSEQLGTGHAVAISEPYLDHDTETVVVLFADQPLLRAETIKELIETHLREHPILTMATTKVTDFGDWRKGFENFSRVIRDASGKLVRTVESKDATDAEKEITEVNPCYFVFDKAWLFEELKKLSNKNAQGEYYLTDLIGMACTEGLHIETVAIDARESVGANSKEQLALLEELLKEISPIAWGSSN